MAQLCPFCLSEKGFHLEKPSGAAPQAHTCDDCHSPVPRSYLADSAKCPAVIINTIGFRAHGKTVYCASLMKALRSMSPYWDGFYTNALSETDLDVINKNIEMLDRGALPDSTPKNFPRPTMVRVLNVPLLSRNATLLFFDTGGECFERASQLVEYAHFVRRARTAMLLISVPDLNDPARQMHNLLNTFIIGMDELQGDTRKQHLLVVYTKADALVPLMSRWDGLEAYLRGGDLASLARTKSYMNTLQAVSNRLEQFTRDELQAYEFLNAAKARFRSVRFCMVSSLGQAPQGKQLRGQAVPRRILDPLLWQMYWARSWWDRLWA